MACATEAVDVVKRPLWIAAHCLHITLSSATLLLSVQFVIKLKKSSLLNDSVKILMLLFTAFADLHAVVLTSIQIHELISNAFHGEACDLGRSTSSCKLANHLVLGCVVGMVACQSVLWIDRFAATAFPTLHRRFGKSLAICLSLATSSIAFVIPILLLRGDPFDDMVPTCLMMPSGSFHRVNQLFYSFVGIGLIAVIAYVSLYIVNLRKKRSLRFNVALRFQAFENLLILRWVGMVVSVQLTFMTTYALAMFLIRTHGHSLLKVTKEMLRNWLYLVPFSTVSLPLISLVALRLCATKRQRSINRMTTENNDGTTHMRLLLRMWS